jgi:metal-responsive CopG/Arc/MetJ family transcriptional regulator
MGRMSVTVDDQLVEQAKEVLGVGTRSEAIRIALQEAVRRRRLAEALRHRGQIDLQVDQEELARLRAEG